MEEEQTPLVRSSDQEDAGKLNHHQHATPLYLYQCHSWYLLVHAEKDETSNEDCYLSQEDYEITEKFEMVKLNVA